MSCFDTTPTPGIAIPLNLNDNVHASPFEVASRSLSDIVKVGMDVGNDVNHARDGRRPSVVLAGIVIVMVVFLAMSMVVVFLLGHPKSHAPVADYAPEFADTLQCATTGVLCLVRQG